MAGTLFHIVLWITVASAEVGRPPVQTETVFGEKTFLPEIVPGSVQRAITSTGDLGVSVEVLYTQDALINWVTNGVDNTSIGETYLRADGIIPSKYTLHVTVPHDLLQNISTDEVSDNSAVEDEDGDFIIDEKELLIKFQTLSLSEAAVLRISLDTEELLEDMETDITQDEEDNTGLGRDESVPTFPEMLELEKETYTVTPGQRTVVQLKALFTENDRFTVRGLIYNWTCDCILTTTWSTSFFLGPSEFVKLPSENEGIEGLNFDDEVYMMEEYSDGTETQIKVITILIPTEKDDVSGVYRVTAHHDMDLAGDSVMLEASLEQMFTVLKSDQQLDPIPPEVLRFGDGDYSQQFCLVGSRCKVSCHIMGMYIESVDLLHKNASSEFVTVNQKHVDQGPYESYVEVVLDSYNPDHSGTYLCTAVSGHTSVTKEIDVNFLVHD